MTRVSSIWETEKSPFAEATNSLWRRAMPSGLSTIPQKWYSAERRPWLYGHTTPEGIIRFGTGPSPTTSSTRYPDAN